MYEIILLYFLQGSVRFSLDGYSPDMDYFEVNEENAEIKLIASLNTDMLQYTVSTVNQPISLHCILWHFYEVQLNMS